MPLLDDVSTQHDRSDSASESVEAERSQVTFNDTLSSEWGVHGEEWVDIHGGEEALHYEKNLILQQDLGPRPDPVFHRPSSSEHEPFVAHVWPEESKDEHSSELSNAKKFDSESSFGEDIQSEASSQGLSAAMNLQEYEARFVHRTIPSAHPRSVNSSLQSKGDSSCQYSQEDSLELSLASAAQAADAIKAMHPLSTQYATLVDPDTGKLMTEDEAVAKIRLEIAGAAAAAAAAEAAAAEAETESVWTEAESTLRDRLEEGLSVMAKTSYNEEQGDFSHFSEINSPHSDRVGEWERGRGKEDAHANSSTSSMDGRDADKKRGRAGRHSSSFPPSDKTGGGSGQETRTLMNEREDTLQPSRPLEVVLRSELGRDGESAKWQEDNCSEAESVGCHQTGVLCELSETRPTRKATFGYVGNKERARGQKVRLQSSKSSSDCDDDTAWGRVLEDTTRPQSSSSSSYYTERRSSAAESDGENGDRTRGRAGGHSSSSVSPNSSGRGSGQEMKILVIEGAMLLSALPQHNYDRISTDIAQSCSPVAAALRMEGARYHREHLKQQNKLEESSSQNQDRTKRILASDDLSNPESMTHRSPCNIKKKDNVRSAGEASNINIVREYQSQQRRRRMSDICTRIHQMQDHIRVVLDDETSTATDIRVSQKLNVVAEIIYTLGRELRKGKNLPLVLRDQHDESLRMASVECLCIVKESGIEAHNILSQSRDSYLEIQKRLNEMEDEVNHIAAGTVLLGTSDDILAPVLEQLYVRWTVHKSPSGRVFKEWRAFSRQKVFEREKLIMEAILKQMQMHRTACKGKMFTKWKKILVRKKRNLDANVANKFLIKMLFLKALALHDWHESVFTKKKIAKLRRRFDVKLQINVLELWNWNKENLRFEASQWKKGSMLANSKLFRKLLYSWKSIVTRKHYKRIKLRAKCDFLRIKSMGQVFNLWHSNEVVKKKFNRREMEKRAKERVAIIFKEWRLLARILRDRKKRFQHLLKRKFLQNRDKFFEQWCAGIEERIIKKIKIAKLVSQNRIFWLTSSFRKWAWSAYVTDRGVGNFKVRRLFKAWKRYMAIIKAETVIANKWNDINDPIRLKASIRNWRNYVNNLHLAMKKLRGVCEAQGGIDEKMCVDRWRAKESKTRLWRFQRRHLQKRRNSFLKMLSWRMWLLNALGKEKLNKKQEHAIRMGHTRHKHLQVKKNFGVLSAYLTYMQAKKRKIVQVAVRINDRRMRLAWSVWFRLIVAARGLARQCARYLRRLKRRSLCLFHKNIKHLVSRMIFGAWCCECKRPFSKEELRDYAQNPEQVDLRLNESERAIVAAKQQRHGTRHHIRALLQDVSKDSVSKDSVSKDSVAGSSENSSYFQTDVQAHDKGLVAEYFREIEEAKIMLAQSTSDIESRHGLAQPLDTRGEKGGEDVGRQVRQPGQLVWQPPQSSHVSRAKRPVRSAWLQLRKELISARQNFKEDLRIDEKDDFDDDEYVDASDEHVHATRDLCKSDYTDYPRMRQDVENLPPYSSKELQKEVIEALEIAKNELLSTRHRFRDASGVGNAPGLPPLQTHQQNSRAPDVYISSEEPVVADKKTFCYDMQLNWGKQLRNNKPLSAVNDDKDKAPRPPSMAKPSHLAHVGLGFKQQYRVKRREIDPKLLENPLYASTSLKKESTPLLPDEKTTRLLRLITAKPPEPCTSYSVDELAEYMAKAAGGGTRAQGVDEDKQKALLRQALLHAHNHSADN